MRTFSTAIRGELNKRFAGEPLVIAEFEWEDGSRVAYCDRKLNDEEYPYPLIVSVSDFSTSTKLTGASDSQSVRIVLNDVSGAIRNILDTKDIHLKQGAIYLGFQGLPITEKALLFEGVINSPVVWDEGSRTLSVELLSKLEDQDVGFTMDDGDFPFIPPGDRNQAWPLVFGQVCNMQAVRVTAVRKGFLSTGVGVMDPTIEERLCQANKLQCPTMHAAMSDQTGPGITIGPAPTPTPLTGSVDTSGATNVKSGKPDQNCVNRRFNEICAILHEREQQEQYVRTSFTLRGVESFPQGEKITIKIDEVRFEGYLEGDTFHVSQTYHPDLEEIDNPPCKDIKAASLGYRFKPSPMRTPLNTRSCQDRGDGYSKDVVDGSAASWEYYSSFEKGRFIWLPPGSEVFLAEEAEVVHIVSLLPGVVDQVAAYRTFGDTKLLVEVPTERYTVHTTDFGGYEVVEVRLNAPLSTIKDEEWDDEIYVSFTSSVGPNPVDIIEWLIGKYTEYTVNAGNFATIKSYMTNYPSNFFLKERMSVLELIQDIAFQSRMAVLIRNGEISLVYLSREPEPIKTIDNSSILSNSFRVVLTETEELATRHHITWSEGDAGVYDDDETTLDFVLKHNIPKYGTFSKEYEYYTQNTYSTIEKSATFWMIRQANTWKYVEFDVPMMHLDLDVFDAFTLNVPTFPTVKCVVTSTTYNVANNTVSIKAWTPVLAGTNEPYYWAWPALQSAVAVFPLPDAVNQSGDPANFPQVTPPIGHPLRGGYDPETARRATDGDRHPSDLDDVFPVPVCKIATGAEIAPDLEPVLTPFEPLAEENFRNDLGKTEASGLNGSSPDDNEQHACGEPSQSLQGCEYEVKVTYITPQGIAPFRSDINGFGGPCTGQSGRPCFGPQHVMCHTFGSYFAASAFQSQKRAEAKALFDSGGYQKGKTDVLNVGPITGIPGDGYAGECEDTGGGGGGGGGGAADSVGETKQPGCASSDEPNCGCGPGSKRNSQQICEPVPGEYDQGKPCPPGHKRDERTRLCVPDPASCPDGTHLNQYGVCQAGEA